VVDLFRDIYADNRRSVRVNQATSDPFYPECGVPQGAVLSPILYAIFINGLAEELSKLPPDGKPERGFIFDVEGSEMRICLLYADDLVLDNLTCRSNTSTSWVS
jgi:hypothetical protein